MKTTLRSAIRLTTNLLFPPRCVHCNSDGALFCNRCEQELTRFRSGELCRRCALPSMQDTCESCFISPPPLDRALAAYAFDPTLHDAVTAFKYRDIRALAPKLGHLLASALPESVSSSVDVMVPAPMSRSRLRSRGYNQSELLARRVSHISGLRMEPGMLVRRIDNGPQASARSQEQRAANVAGAFEAAVPADSLRVLLIDDVMTTGSTLNACATALKDAGADWVGALVLAREL